MQLFCVTKADFLQDDISCNLCINTYFNTISELPSSHLLSFGENCIILSVWGGGNCRIKPSRFKSNKFLPFAWISNTNYLLLTKTPPNLKKHNPNLADMVHTRTKLQGRMRWEREKQRNYNEEYQATFKKNEESLQEKVKSKKKESLLKMQTQDTQC